MRKNRADGQLTKQKILLAAGRLFAERGYHNTASKDICLAAKVNSAAINYHFGSKDDLYEKIMEAAIEHFLHKDFLLALDRSERTAAQKLDALLHHIVNNVLDKRSWHGKVWAREIVSPSPLAPKLIENETAARISIIKKIILDASGAHYQVDDINTTYSLFTLLAPCMMLMIVNPDLPTPIQPLFSRPKDELVTYITNLVMQLPLTTTP